MTQHRGTTASGEATPFLQARHRDEDEQRNQPPNAMASKRPPALQEIRSAMGKLWHIDFV